MLIILKFIPVFYFMTMLRYAVLLSLFVFSANTKLKSINCPTDLKTIGLDVLRKSNYTINKDDYDVKFYFIELEVTDTSTFIKGSTSILIEILHESQEQVILDMYDSLLVDSVFIESIPATYLHSNNEIIINAPNPIPSGNMVFFSAQLVSLQAIIE
jgi:hypothetical protein